VKPRVVIYNQISLDGRLTGFPVDMDLYYSLIPNWQENATLIGSNTILAANASSPQELSEEAGADRPPVDPEDSRPLLVGIDSRGRVPNWIAWRSLPFIRDVVVLASQKTPAQFLEKLAAWKIDAIITGDEHVDLPTALELLNLRYNIQVVRIDSGGILNGVLLQAGLVDEVSLLLTPCIAGDHTTPFVHTPNQAPGFIGFKLRLFHSQTIGEGLLWLRYEVIKS
jgi:2,5-diamino-6-(ribosylamino)-4(3H)-pyrimidinone 5'-phosphate reductase